MKSKRLRAVIVGCGQIAGGYDQRLAKGVVLTHARAYGERSDVSLVAVADPLPGKARAFARRWRVPRVFNEAGALLRETRPDLVSVCSPNETHADVLRQCLAYSVKGVWCEKPLCLDVGEGQRLVAEFKKRRIPLMVNYTRRWVDQVRRVKDVFGAHAPGPIRVTGVYTKGLRHNGSHSVDLLRHWFGEPVGWRVVRRVPDDSSDDRVVDVILRFQPDVTAVLVGLGRPGHSLWELDIVSPRTRVRFLNGGFETEWQRVMPSRLFPGFSDFSFPPQRVATNLGVAMRHALSNFLAAVRRGTPLVSGGESALGTLALCQRMLAGPRVNSA